MHDLQYRIAIAWQNTAYYQPPQVSFYLGDGMTIPPKPNIITHDVITKIGNEDQEIQPTSTLFPNPFNESIEIRSKDEFNFEDLDLTGNILEAGRGRNIKKIGFELLPGIYIIKIHKETNTEIVRVVKN